jgi:putative transposase
LCVRRSTTSRLPKEQGVTCSLSRRAGEARDNPAMGSFFSLLKTERTARKVYGARTQVRADVFDYFERFYNRKRCHSTLDQVSPAQFEKAQLA